MLILKGCADVLMRKNDVLMRKCADVLMIKNGVLMRKCANMLMKIEIQLAHQHIELLAHQIISTSNYQHIISL